MFTQKALMSDLSLTSAAGDAEVARESELEPYRGEALAPPFSRWCSHLSLAQLSAKDTQGDGPLRHFLIRFVRGFR
jgi:hypothetical protein